MKMSLRDLYTEVILDHYKKPRNKGEVTNPTHHAKGHNPLCGDKLDLWIKVENGVIANIGFTGTGCAIHTASTSMLTEKVKGKSIAEIKNLKSEDILEMLGVTLTPTRLKCALLPLEVLHKAISSK